MSDIPESAVRAAAEAVNAKAWRGEDRPFAAHGKHQFDGGCSVCRGDVDAIVSVAIPAAVDALAGAGRVVASAEERRELLALLGELADPNPCEFDHEGDCQAHGPTSTWEGCPHARARELLAALPEKAPATTDDRQEG